MESQVRYSSKFHGSLSHSLLQDFAEKNLAADICQCKNSGYTATKIFYWLQSDVVCPEELKEAT